jgi:endonuclease/exonuclease/phosphatase family metal-dependent hydrolase
MGHSQGSQVLIELLKKGMTEEQRQLMVAAYCIGYHVTAEELSEYPVALQPATDSIMQGLVVFNSVTDTTAIGMVSRGDVVGINPTTWMMATNIVPAEYHLGMAKYNDNRDSVLIVPCHTRTYLYKHTTVCPDLDPDMVFIPAYEDMFPRGNLHFADSWLYGGNVLENMRCRLRNFEKSHQIKIMSYNVQHCAGMDKKVDYDRTAEVIRKCQPDVVALQELDSVTGRSGQLDQLAELANRTHYYPIFGSAIDFDGGKYGVGILTHERPLSTKRIPLPGEEPRVLLVVEFQNYVLACTHLDLEEPQRLASIPLIVAEANRWQKPFILAGDWNDTPDTKLMNEMANHFTILCGQSPSYPADTPQECLDYIASFKGQSVVTLDDSVIDEPEASDHRPVVVGVQLPLFLK